MLDQDWVPSHAAPARDVRAKRFGKSLVYFPSRKNHTQLICESHYEAHMCLLLEFQTEVTQYYIQPVSHRYDPNNKSCQYTPDFFVQREDGRHYFIELKNKFMGHSSRYDSILDHFSAVASGLGYGFEIFAFDDFPVDDTLDNLGLLYSRSDQVTAYEQRQLVECLQGWTGPLTIRYLLTLQAPPSLRSVCAAIFQKKIDFDMRDMLTLITPLFTGQETTAESLNDPVRSTLSLAIYPQATQNFTQHQFSDTYRK